MRIPEPTFGKTRGGASDLQEQNQGREFKLKWKWPKSGKRRELQPLSVPIFGSGK